MAESYLANVRAQDPALGNDGIKNLTTIPIHNNNVDVVADPTSPMQSKFVMRFKNEIGSDEGLLLIPDSEKDNLKFSTTEYTVAMWYKLTYVGGGSINRIIMANRNGSNSYVSSISLSDQSNGYFFGNRPGYINRYDDDFLVKNVAAENDKWYHLALTFNNVDGLRMFVNGELVSGPNNKVLTQKIRGQCGMDTEGLSIGGYIARTQFSFDDVCIINDKCLWTSNFTPPTTYLSDYVGGGGGTTPTRPIRLLKIY